MSGDINKAQSMIKHHHPDIGGLFCCTIGGSLEFPQAQGDKWMQIVHDGNDHWVLIAKGFSQPEHVLVYDSLPGSPHRYSNHILIYISSLLESANKEMTYIVKTCQRQSNGYDCGVFAIAFAASLANGEDLTTRLYDPKNLRSHLIECFSSEKLSQFPSTPSRSTRWQEN